MKLAEMIRKREITSREVVDAHIARVQEVNPILNAVVKDRFEDARAEADAADRALRKSGKAPLPPLHGVPCTVKEAFALEGMPSTGGLLSRKDHISREDATVVARLRRAGAIPLGITNVPELCMWMETYNRIYGRTNNPYDPRRIPGGSSGGEGAIIGAGASPFGVGSDIGGSIRMPAFFNGVFGHKPTGGLVPNTGQWPIAEGKARSYLTTGPLARRAEDLMPLLRIMAGPDGKDYACKRIRLGDPNKVNLKNVTVLDVEGNGRIEVSAELRRAQANVARALEQRGLKVKKAQFNGLKQSMEIWSAMMASAGGPTFSELLGNGTAIKPLRQLGLWFAGASPHTIPAIVLAAMEKVTQWMPGRVGKFVESGLALKRDLVSAIGPRGVMLYPSYTRPAPFHNRPLLRPFDWLYTAILNVMELPVTQVPLGLNGEGVPLGLQVAAVHGNDHVTIRVAMEIEKIFGGWVMPRRGG